ncbi:hypothetical protein CEE36_04100 [candidate division TA06 bacterium B3_TA06]|uniref:YaaC-like Protein n=1 Tax=candidate division TA06 bacterium B3_TA06 TaxID=2012487 RepID=A0A532V8H6_UNCT6|nr:MAG: hypothetical protein CEE36_04100 [candidate division TA06 bacterium B3_TA06]
MSRPFDPFEGGEYILHREKKFTLKRKVQPLRKSLLGATEPWSMVSIFFRESAEREMKKRGIVKTSAKLKRARAFLEQSQEFFSASKEASHKSAPMLIYYSMLNFAKAIIELYKVKPNFYTHGISVPELPSWARLRLAKVKLQPKGVFKELADLIGFSYKRGEQISGEQIFVNCPGCLHEVKSVLNRNTQRVFINGIGILSNSYDKCIDCWVEKEEATRLTSRRIGKLVDLICVATGMKWVSSSSPKYWLRFQTEPQGFRGKKARDKLFDWLETQHVWIEQIFFAEKSSYCIRVKQSNLAPLPSTIAIYLGMFYLNHLSRYCPDHLERLVFHKDYHLAQVFMGTQPIEFFLALASHAIGADFYYV